MLPEVVSHSFHVGSGFNQLDDVHQVLWPCVFQQACRNTNYITDDGQPLEVLNWTTSESTSYD
jgi:hypothetical protein